MRTKIVAKKTSGSFRTKTAIKSGVTANEMPAWAGSIDTLFAELVRTGMDVNISAPFTGPSRVRMVRVWRRLQPEVARRTCWGDCQAAMLVPLRDLVEPMSGGGSVLAYRLWKLAEPLYKRLQEEGKETGG